MADAVAEAYYGMPEELKEEALGRLDQPIRDLVHQFRKFYRRRSGKPASGCLKKLGMEPDDPFLKDNPFLEKCITDAYRQPEKNQNPVSILQALLICMRQEGHILIPVESPASAGKVLDSAKTKASGDIRAEEEIHWKLIPLTNGKGKIRMPVFTSIEQLHANGPDGCSTISFFIFSVPVSAAKLIPL